MVTASRARKVEPLGREFRVGAKFGRLSPERRRVFRAHSSKYNPGYFGPEIPKWMTSFQTGAATPETRFRAYSMIRRDEPAVRIAEVCKVRKGTIASWVCEAVLHAALPESALDHPLLKEFPGEVAIVRRTLAQQVSRKQRRTHGADRIGIRFPDGFDPVSAEFVRALAGLAGRNPDEIAGYVGAPTALVVDFLRASARMAPIGPPADDAPPASASMDEVVGWLRGRAASVVVAWASRTGRHKPVLVAAHRLEPVPDFLREEVNVRPRALSGPSSDVHDEGPVVVTDCVKDAPLLAEVTTSVGFSFAISAPRDLVDESFERDLGRLLRSNPWRGDVRFVFGDREAWRRLGDLAAEASGPAVESRDVVTRRRETS